MNINQKQCFGSIALKSSLVLLLGVVACEIGATLAHAAPLGDGNLLIYRVGTGSGSLGTTATAVFLDEYTVSGSLVQSLAMPTTGATALTAVGNATTEGVISRSQDGTTFVFTGYRKDAGLANPGSDTAATTARVIATLPFSGVANTSIALTDAGGNGSIRSATTIDGSTFYTSASSGVVRYIGTPTASSTSVLIDGRNSRQLNLSGNVLYAANGSTAITGKVQHYGTLPTTATAATPIVSLTTADAVNGFALFDLNPGIAGDDTLYALSTVESRLRKYTFDGSIWTANGFIATTAANLTGVADGSAVSLYLTTGSSLLNLYDTSGYGNNISGSIHTLATAGANTAFRGLGIVPEPSAIFLGLFAAAGLVIFRRRR